MLTLTDHPENIEIATLIDNGKKTPIYWHPKKNKDLKLEIDDIKKFNTEEFRQRFAITRVQSEEILDHLVNDTEPTTQQSIFFKVKAFINNSLYVEMDLRSSDSQSIEVNFPKGNDTWGELSIVAGASGSGKTYYIADKIKRNLDGKKKNRRRFFWISSEFNKDKTLKTLKKDKYRNYFTGVDVGEQAFKLSMLSKEEFFKRDVFEPIEQLRPGSCLVLGDPQDASISEYLRPLITKMLRTSRHDAIGLLYIVNIIRSGSWSSQAHNSVKYFVLFPRSGKGKVRNYLNQDIGLTMKQARENVSDFAESGRILICRLHAPQALISDKLIRLI